MKSCFHCPTFSTGSCCSRSRLITILVAGSAPDGTLSSDGDFLTALYERAKFSHHTIDATMKDDAIEALEEVGRQADTDDPRLVLGLLGHGFPLLLTKHYRM